MPSPFGSIPSGELPFKPSIPHLWQVVAVDRLDQLRSHDEHQFGFLLLKRLRFEEGADDRNVADDWNPREGFGFIVIKQTSQRERLTITEFNPGLGSSRSQRRHDKAVELDSIRVVNGGNLGLEFQTDMVFIDDGGFEVQANPILLPHNRDAHAAPPVASAP